jgi:hypothetical protein
LNRERGLNENFKQTRSAAGKGTGTEFFIKQVLTTTDTKTCSKNVGTRNERCDLSMIPFLEGVEGVSPA